MNQSHDAHTDALTAALAGLRGDALRPRGPNTHIGLVTALGQTPFTLKNGAAARASASSRRRSRGGRTMNRIIAFALMLVASVNTAMAAETAP